MDFMIHLLINLMNAFISAYSLIDRVQMNLFKALHQRPETRDQRQAAFRFMLLARNITYLFRVPIDIFNLKLRHILDKQL